MSQSLSLHCLLTITDGYYTGDGTSLYADFNTYYNEHKRLYNLCYHLHQSGLVPSDDTVLQVQQHIVLM